MRQITREAKRLPDIRTLAVHLTKHLPARARYAEIETLFDYVRGHIRYVADVRGIETLTVPIQTLKQRAGDCDDMAMLLASLLEAIGHETRFSAYAFERDPLGNFVFGHVLTETPLGHRAGQVQWLALDPTVAEPMGWRPPDSQTLHILQIYNGADQFGRDRQR